MRENGQDDLLQVAHFVALRHSSHLVEQLNSLEQAVGSHVAVGHDEIFIISQDQF